MVETNEHKSWSSRGPFIFTPDYCELNPTADSPYERQRDGACHSCPTKLLSAGAVRLSHQRSFESSILRSWSYPFCTTPSCPFVTEKATVKSLCESNFCQDQPTNPTPNTHANASPRLQRACGHGSTTKGTCAEPREVPQVA